MKKEKIDKYYAALFKTADDRRYDDDGNLDKEKTTAWVDEWVIISEDDMTQTKGNTLNEFFSHMFSICNEDIIIRVNFHGLKYYGTFIIDWLINNNFSEKESLRTNNKYKTLIDGDGNYFHITVQYNNCRICFEDSEKKMPGTIEDIAHNLKIERDGSYITDCVIIATALKKVLLDRGFYKMTAASNAINHFKELKHCDFRRRFPLISPEEDEFVRKSYKGGLCLTNGTKEYTGDIYVLDKNSMYPSQMHSLSGNLYPVGHGVYFKGKYEYDALMPLYVAHIYITCTIKPGHFPCISEKHCYSDRQDFLTECDDKELYVNNIDLDNIFENYDIEQLDYIDGYKYQPALGLFDSYIDYWYGIKSEATKTGDLFLRLCSKIFLNSLYGKFGQKLIAGKQKLELDKNGILKGTTKTKECEGIYIPVATFVTAYARRDLLRSANLLGGTNTVLYMDTDSLHTINKDFEKVLNIDNVKLNCWKLENIAQKGIYIRQKTYAECINNEWVIKCAGMSKDAKGNVKPEDFAEGAEFSGNRKLTRVKGGSIYENCTFTIK